MEDSPARAVFALFVAIPVLLFFACIVFGGLIAACESWSWWEACQYVFSSVAGLCNPLTNKSPVRASCVHLSQTPMCLVSLASLWLAGRNRSPYVCLLCLLSSQDSPHGRMSAVVIGIPAQGAVGLVVGVTGSLHFVIKAIDRESLQPVTLQHPATPCYPGINPLFPVATQASS